MEFRGDDNFGAGFPIGARSIPVGTRPCLQGIVCYTSAEGDRRRMPAGRAADAVCGMDADCFSAAKGTCPDNPRRRGIPFAFRQPHTMRKSVL